MNSLRFRFASILVASAALADSSTHAQEQILAAATAPAAGVATGVVGLTGAAAQPMSHFNLLALIVGYLAITLIGLFGFVILWRIHKGKIDISKLISEADGAASLSRFQFLIFTFVISLSLLLIIIGAKDGPQFPESIPAGIYALLGISAGSYVVSKGIQKGAENPATPDDRVSPNNENAG